MRAVNVLAPEVGLAPACAALRIPRSTVYRDDARRRRLSVPPLTSSPRPAPPLALSPAERQALRDVLCSERFADCAPPSVYATLLDEGRYLGSVRTMYRLLAADGQARERRNQLTHPAYAKPELLATGPNQVWSWDITKLKGPLKWTCFQLYVILDIFSRYVVGWLIAPRESAELARQLIAETVAKQGVEPRTLTVHADRGTSMRSKLVAELLVDLDVAKSHSRPYVSDDNPFSEAQFKTLKYRPDFPERFGSIEEARAHCQRFFQWYDRGDPQVALAPRLRPAIFDVAVAVLEAHPIARIEIAAVEGVQERPLGVGDQIGREQPAHRRQEPGALGATGRAASAGHSSRLAARSWSAAWVIRARTSAPIGAVPSAR
jgi:putative transposase